MFQIFDHTTSIPINFATFSILNYYNWVFRTKCLHKTVEFSIFEFAGVKNFHFLSLTYIKKFSVMVFRIINILHSFFTLSKKFASNYKIFTENYNF